MKSAALIDRRLHKLEVAVLGRSASSSGRLSRYHNK